MSVQIARQVLLIIDARGSHAQQAVAAGIAAPPATRHHAADSTVSHTRPRIGRDPVLAKVSPIKTLSCRGTRRGARDVDRQRAVVRVVRAGSGKHAFVVPRVHQPTAVPDVGICLAVIEIELLGPVLVDGEEPRNRLWVRVLVAIAVCREREPRAVDQPDQRRGGIRLRPVMTDFEQVDPVASALSASQRSQCCLEDLRMCRRRPVTRACRRIPRRRRLRSRWF